MNRDFGQKSKLLNCVIIENENGATLFQNSIKIITTHNPDEFSAKIDELQAAIDDGKFTAGFLSYEAGYLFEETLNNLLPPMRKLPLLWFAIFDDKIPLSSTEYKAFLADNTQSDDFILPPLFPTETTEEYANKLGIIHEAIKNGVFYQTNFTMKLKGRFIGDDLALFRALKTRQNGKYGAYIKTDNFTILSLSPELGFAINDGAIECHPMKGTAPIGDAEILRHDEKNLAENLMIVDLMRNDFSRIAKPKSVNVPKLFAIEDYETLHQMVSIVKAKLRDNIKIKDILRAIFPLGSITGAPKISAMAMIAAQELEAREAYCGSVGYFAPNGDAVFNVAIRTPIIINNDIEMGIGSGIIYDSISDDEYDECLLKGKFLTDTTAEYTVFETLKWDSQNGFGRAELHIERLLNSVHDLGLWRYHFTPEFFIQKLSETAENIPYDSARVKISIDNYSHEIAIFPFEDIKSEWKIKISKTPINSQNPLLYYKTNHRDFYEKEWAKANDEGFDEVIFTNENGELTEGSRTNIFIDKGDGILRTPPINCGLLGGILRKELLQTKSAIQEILYVQDIINAKMVYVGNSLRGLKPAIKPCVMIDI